jgi:hypothetical protein
MGNIKNQRVLPFCVEGKFLGFAGETLGDRKYLRLEIETGELQIKLAKEIRVSVPYNLPLHTPIQVTGEQSIDVSKGALKLKAYQVQETGDRRQETEEGRRQKAEGRSFNSVLPSASPDSRFPTPDSRLKILVCQKSSCRKRGTQLCQALKAALCDRNLQHRVEFKYTGCLKRCSSAPGLMLMPGKTCLSRMHPEAIASLVEKL